MTFGVLKSDPGNQKPKVNTFRNDRKSMIFEDFQPDAGVLSGGLSEAPGGGPNGASKHCH